MSNKEQYIQDLLESDEKLAKFIINSECENCPLVDTCTSNVCSYDTCIQPIIEWLHKPVL